MSTIATQLNWGTSYIINDFYKRFVKPGKDEKYYVLSSRVTTIILMLISLVVTLFISKISGAWSFIIECGAGVGLVLILRWFWWRINAWSEISAMIAPFIIFPVIKSLGILFPYSLFIIVPGTTLVWVVVTYLTKPTSDEVLISFYKKFIPVDFCGRKFQVNYPTLKVTQDF